MMSKKENLKRLVYILNFYKENKPKNDKQYRKALKDYSKLSQLSLFSEF